jgi:ferredoxin
VLANPEVFDFDDDGYGVVLQSEPGPEHADDIATAIANCPEGAISRT